MVLRENLERLLEQGQDGAMLRFGLGKACLGDHAPEQAVPHLRKAIEFDPSYSAAWKLLGKALTETGDKTAAAEAYGQGIEAAERKGDIQAAKEMKVFLRRLEK